MSGVGWLLSTYPFQRLLLKSSPRHGLDSNFYLLQRNEILRIILPTLLRGKLVDYYVDLDATTKADLNLLKAALMKKAGLTQDPLTAGKLFISRCQRSGEKAVDFANHLKKLFKQAYRRGFGLWYFAATFPNRIDAPVSQQILLRGQPTTFEQAVQNAKEVKYALITIYKGMKLGEATPRHIVMLVDDNRNDVVAIQTDRSQALDFSFDRSDLTFSEETQLLNLLTQFADLFAPAVKHSIPTEGPPVWQPLRRIPEALKDVVDVEVTRMLDQGVVRPNSSPWSSPVVMVKKKDGSWWFCVDYRKLNSVTHQDAYPLPRIDATLDSLAGATYFTTLDLAFGYWQVEVEEQDKKKNSFFDSQRPF